MSKRFKRFKSSTFFYKGIKLKPSIIENFTESVIASLTIPNVVTSQTDSNILTSQIGPNVSILRKESNVLFLG